jgi:hypothetical protein
LLGHPVGQAMSMDAVIFSHRLVNISLVGFRWEKGGRKVARLRVSVYRLLSDTICQTEENRVCLELGSSCLLWVSACGTGTVPCAAACKWAGDFPHILSSGGRRRQDAGVKGSAGIEICARRKPTRAFTILKYPDPQSRKADAGQNSWIRFGCTAVGASSFPIAEQNDVPASESSG